MATMKAHAIALMFLPFVRDSITSPTPLHLIHKPTVGTGSTLLATACLTPALGQGCFVQLLIPDPPKATGDLFRKASLPTARRETGQPVLAGDKRVAQEHPLCSVPG